MKYDTLEVTNDGVIKINGQRLLDIIREIEMPFT